MKLLLANIISIICIGGALAMALNGVSYWGWFLFVGLICSHTSVE